MAAESVIRVRNARRTGLGGVVLAGHIRGSAGVRNKPMRVLGSYAVVYLLAGGGRFADGFGFASNVGPGDLLLLFPDVPHSYGPAENGHWSEVYIVFDGQVFDLWRRLGFLDPARPIHHLEPVDQWAKRFEEVLSPHPQPGVGTALAEICRLQTLLAEAVVGPDRGAPTESEEQRWLARATALLDADPTREANLGRVAAEVGYSYDGFRKRFRRLSGMSPARYRSIRSIDRACELMAEGTWSDREIAAKLGYCDEFHFSHRFKQLTGRTPRQFRAVLQLGEQELRPESTSKSASRRNTRRS